MRLVIDVNIWVSFGMGKQLARLPEIVQHPAIQIFACRQLEAELTDVCSRPKLQRYLSQERVQEIFELLARYAVFEEPLLPNAAFKDAKDNYLLDLCETIQADYLVTGDIPLLTLEHYNHTKIIPFRELLALMEAF